MADLKIDSLQLEIESDSSSAEKSLDRLTTSLMGLNTSLKKIGNNAGNLRKIFTSMSNLSSLRMPDFSATYTQLRNISGLSFDNFNASKIKGVSDAFRELDADRLSQISNSINLMAQAFTNMNSVNIKDNGINTFVEAIKGFRDVKLPTDQFAPFVQVIGDFAALDMSNYNSKIGDFTSALARLAKTDVKMTSTDVETLINSISKVATIDFSTYNKDITNFVNALARLANVNYEKQEGGIMNYISAMREFTTLDTSNFNTGVTSFVNALKGLANADLSKYTSILQSFLVVMKNLVSADISPYTSQLTDFVKQITKLATADGLSENTAETLRSIGNAISEFVANVSTINISDNLANTVSGLAQLANQSQNVGQSLAKSSNDVVAFSSRGKILINVVKSIGDAFRTIDSAIRKFATSSMSALKSAASKIEELTKHKPNVDGLNIGFKSLLKTVLGFKGLSGVFNWLKESVMLGAEITEIDHIVESVFGRDMVGYVNEWAENAVDKFGIAANSAKKYAGTLTAMFQAANVSGRDSAKMALDLVELAGDLSAFYNIDTATAYKKIQSGMAGMTKPLQQIGISLHAATLAEYAQSKGIEKKYSAMSQAEKVMLRYQYIMEVTKNQSGDFARTNLSLANQLRVLKANVQSLSTEFGAGLAAAIRHVVIGLNQIMKYAVKAAQAFRYLMETIFGKYKGGASGVALDASMIEDSSDYAGDLADNTGDASDALADADKNAKDLKKDLSVLPFDELNQLSKKKDKSSDTSGIATGLGGYGDELLDSLTLDEAEREMSKFEQFVKRWADSIKIYFKAHAWEMLGKAIAQGLNKGISELHKLLNPDEVGAMINPWIDAFTRTFNSLVDNLNFHELGATIGDGVNILVRAANRILDPDTGINWQNLGKKLSEGANGLVDQIEWDEMGELFANKINFPWQIAYGFVTGFEWGTLGASLAEGANAFVDKIDFPTMADTVSVGLNGIVEAVQKFLDDFDAHKFGVKLGTNFKRMIDGVSWGSLGKALASIWNEAWEFLVAFIRNIGEGGNGLSVQEAIDEKLAIKHERDYNGGKLVGTGLGKAIRDAMTGALESIEIGDMLDAVNSLFQKVFQDIQAVFGKTDNWYKLGQLIGQAISGIIGNKDTMEEAAGAIHSIADAIGALFSGAIDELSNHADEIKEGITTFFKGLPWDFIFKAVAITAGIQFAKAVPMIFGGLVVKKALKSTITKAVGDAIGESVASAGAGSAGGAAAGGGLLAALSKSILGTAATTAGAAGLTVGIVKVGEAAKSLFEVLKGGNGTLSDSGETVQKYINKMSEFRDISGDTEKKLFNLKETWESGDIDDATFFSKFSQILADGGMNADKARGFLGLLKNEVGLTDEQMKLLESTIAGLGEGTDDFGTDISTFTLNTEENAGKIIGAFSQVEASLRHAFNEEASQNMANAGIEFKNLVANGESVETAFQKVIDKFGITGKEAEQLKYAIQSELGTNAFNVLTSGAETSANKIGTLNDKLKTTGGLAEVASKHQLAYNDAADKTPGIFDTLGTLLGGLATNLLASFGAKTQYEEKSKDNLKGYKGAIDDNKQEYIIDPVSNAVNEAFTGVDSSKQPAESGKNIDEGLGKGIEENVKVITDAIDWISKQAVDELKDANKMNSPSELYATEAENIPLGIAKGILNREVDVTDAIKTISSAMETKFDEVMPSIENKAEGYGESIVGKIETAFENKANQIDFSSKVSSMFSSVWDELRGISDDFYSWGKTIAQSLSDGMKQMNLPTLQYSVSTWDNHNWGNGATVSTPRLSPHWYRKGGLFTNPSIIGIGEAGEEAALPLENKKAMSKIANAITSNMNGVGMDERTLTNAFINAIMATSSTTQQEPTFNITVKTMNDEVLARAVQRGNRSLNYRNSPGYAGAN